MSNGLVGMMLEGERMKERAGRGSGRLFQKEKIVRGDGNAMTVRFGPLSVGWLLMEFQGRCHSPRTNSFQQCYGSFEEPVARWKGPCESFPVRSHPTVNVFRKIQPVRLLQCMVSHEVGEATDSRRLSHCGYAN